MSISDRLGPVLPYIEIQLVRSLPVIDNGCEVVFFYKAKETDQEHYAITEIKYIVYRDVFSGEIRKINAADILPEELINSIIGVSYSYAADTMKEIEAAEEYMTEYEELLEHLTLYNSIDGVKIKKISVLLGKIKEVEPVKSVYAYLSKDFTAGFAAD